MAGRIKKKLALVLELKLNEMGYSATVDPDRLVYQPNGGSAICDWAKWCGEVLMDGRWFDVISWDSMQACTKGIDVSIGGRHKNSEISVSAKELVHHSDVENYSVQTSDVRQ